MTTNRIYGWRPEKPDQRDAPFRDALRARLVAVAPPPHFDQRPRMPHVYDQGQLGSCTSNAIGGAIEFMHQKLKKIDFMPSRLFIYYNERVIEHTVNYDAGAEIRDGIKSVAKQGACHEALWPYTISKFTHKPSAACYSDALKNVVKAYAGVDQILGAIKSCIALDFPVVMGFTVYESFESDVVTKTGVVPMPGSSEQVLGGHAVLICGYDDASSRFIARNSWGANWGQAGYFTVPYDYWLNPDLASDFWQIDVA